MAIGVLSNINEIKKVIHFPGIGPVNLYILPLLFNKNKLVRGVGKLSFGTSCQGEKLLFLSVALIATQ